jgi:hypothetical protein
MRLFAYVHTTGSAASLFIGGHDGLSDITISLREGLSQQLPVLVVAPLSGHHAPLLRETVVELLARHDVYITDWADARDVPASHGEFYLKDYVRYVQDSIRDIGAQAHVIAICQPTVPVLAAVSLIASDGELQPRTMTSRCPRCGATTRFSQGITGANWFAPRSPASLLSTSRKTAEVTGRRCRIFGSTSTKDWRRHARLAKTA